MVTEREAAGSPVELRVTCTVLSVSADDPAARGGDGAGGDRQSGGASTQSGGRGAPHGHSGTHRGEQRDTGIGRGGRRREG